MDYGKIAQTLMAPWAGIRQNVGDVIPFRRQSIEPGMGLSEGARPYSGGANPLPPDARLSDVPGFRLNRPLTSGEITADQSVNQAIRSAGQRLSRVYSGEELNNAMDRIFSASVRANPQYEIARELGNILGPKK